MNYKGSNSSEEKVEIKLNRKMRAWHKYKNYIIIGGGILVVVILMILLLKGCGEDGGAGQQATTPQQIIQPTGTVDNNEQQETTKQEETTTQETQPTTAAQTGNASKLEGTAAAAEFVGKDSFNGVTFVGDSIISGFSYYGYIDDANVIADGNMTSDKSLDYVSQVAATNPSKVVLMVGLNDLNYGTRGADTIAGYIADFVSQVKSSVPSAQVYVVSVLPVTSEFEARSSVNVTQSGIDELNSRLSEQAADKGYSFIDAATSYKDGTGYLGESYTGNGSNLHNEYYPFLLNGLAGVIK